jgi:hypothetical protein
VTGADEQADAPPPIPPAEMPAEELVRIVDNGDVAAVETALREQNVRLPDVLDQVDRILEKGWGNLAAALVTMLVATFHIARADRLADRVLEHKDSAGNDELSDLAAALFVEERLSVATRVLEVVLAREADHGRALYLRARIFARRGAVDRAFELISRVSPKLLGPHGMAIQARYALLARREKAIAGALKHTKHSDDPDVVNQVREVERIRERIAKANEPFYERAKTDLRAMMALEYGATLIELATDPTDSGRFGMETITFRDCGRLLEKIAKAITALGLPIHELLFATEDGEIVATGLEKLTGKPAKQWQADRKIADGSWLCMASAATHPHLPNLVVKTIQTALDQGTLRTLALILPCGWRGPLVPDLIGRITGDDEMPFAIDDEVEDVLGEIFDESQEPSTMLVREDGEELARHLDESKPLLRALEPEPRAGHVPFLDETPIARG